MPEADGLTNLTDNMETALELSASSFLNDSGFFKQEAQTLPKLQGWGNS